MPATEPRLTWIQTVAASGDLLRSQLAPRNLALVFAAESGSRAWGFASPDSDYDVRFVFTRSPEGYLSIHNGVEDLRHQDGDLDAAGWDLRKALRLAEKSNPALLEWLGSPVVYADPVGFKGELLAILQAHFSPRALACHYYNFMRSIRWRYLAGPNPEPTLKRYLYALRPISCTLWMEANPLRLPPVRFVDAFGAVELD